MSEVFDPYHRWLGISPKDQPPNHYRLLGLELLEGDPEVIRDAAEQRIAHVRTYQLGPHSALSQKLLNELGAAKACLLSVSRKAEYDAAIRKKLQRRLAGAPAKGTGVPSTNPIAIPVKRVAGIVDSTGEARGDTRRASVPRTVSPPSLIILDKRNEIDVPAAALVPTFNRLPPSAFLPRKRTSRWLLVSGGSGIAVVILGLCVLVLFRGSGDREGLAVHATPNKEAVASQTSEEPPSGSQPGTSPPPPAAPAFRPPKLTPIRSYVIDEGTVIQFQVALADSGSGAPRFRLGLGAPTGATIDPTTGVFAWRPGREQSPGEYTITVVATPEGINAASDETTFHVSVRRQVRTAFIASSTQRSIHPGETVQFRVVSMFPDGRPESVRYKLENAPPWMKIDAATGIVTCNPDKAVSPGTYVAIASVLMDGQTNAQQQTLNIYVLSPLNAPVAHHLATIPKTNPYSFPPSVSTNFDIELPSGKTVTSKDARLTKRVENEADTIYSQCISEAPGVIGLFQEGSRIQVVALSNVKATKLHGTTVLLQPLGHLKLKEYLTYRNGILHGVAAAWNSNGKQEFWCNYLNGKPDGVCCLFVDDQLVAIAECRKDKVESLHLIDENKRVKSFAMLDEAKADPTAKARLDQIDKLFDRMETTDREYRARVKQAMNAGIGVLNQKKRDSMRARSNERGAAAERSMKNLWKAGLGK